MTEYQYRGTVNRWIDGDTVDLTLDLGFRITKQDRFRLYGVDTPERGQPGYREATQFSEQHAPIGSTVTVATYKRPDAFGRYLAVLHTPQGNLNDALLASGHAEPYVR